MTKLHFWVTLLDKAVGNNKYFPKMSNPGSNIIENNKDIINPREEERIEASLQIYEDDRLVF